MAPSQAVGAGIDVAANVAQQAGQYGGYRPLQAQNLYEAPITLSNGEPVPPLFILKQDPRYLRAVVRAVLDGEMELATIELRLGVSVPNSAMKHLLNLKDGAKSTLEIKALVMLAMSMEMGWAVLEPFLFAATEIDSTEQERLLEHVRQMRAEMLESLLK
ncbi:MAG: hypothetical protein EBU84_15120 [Actinobacteria bacterium]|nr:hypothetical protein [Actinomycetota bacterium]